MRYKNINQWLKIYKDRIYTALSWNELSKKHKLTPQRVRQIYYQCCDRFQPYLEKDINYFINKLKGAPLKKQEQKFIELEVKIKVKGRKKIKINKNKDK